jgi:hypothetical protein
MVLWYGSTISPILSVLAPRILDTIPVKRFFLQTMFYKEMKAKYYSIWCCFAMRHNPYYNHLPLQGNNKGELFIVRIADLRLDCIIKSSSVLMHYKE